MTTQKRHQNFDYTRIALPTMQAKFSYLLLHIDVAYTDPLLSWSGMFTVSQEPQCARFRRVFTC